MNNPNLYEYEKDCLILGFVHGCNKFCNGTAKIEQKQH